VARWVTIVAKALAKRPTMGPMMKAGDQNVLGQPPSATYPVHPAPHDLEPSELPKSNVATVATSTKVPSEVIGVAQVRIQRDYQPLGSVADVCPGSPTFP
jgi:hypothetical protein